MAQKTIYPLIVQIRSQPAKNVVARDIVQRIAEQELQKGRLSTQAPPLGTSKNQNIVSPVKTMMEMSIIFFILSRTVMST